MSDEMNGKSHKRSTTRAAAQRGWQKTAALVFVLLAAGLPEALGQQVLSWKFKEGDVLRYTTDQTTLQTVTRQGKERKQKRAQSATYTWSIGRVSADGEADVTQRIERVTMKVEAPHSCRSSTTRIPRLPQFRSRSRARSSMLKATVGAEFSFKMKPSGEIVEYQDSRRDAQETERCLARGGRRG